MSAGSIALSVFVILFSFYAGMKWNGDNKAPIFLYRVGQSHGEHLVIAYNENDARSVHPFDGEITRVGTIPDKIENPTILWICAAK